MTQLTHIPHKHAAGTSLSVRRVLPLHKPADGWRYQLALRIPGLSVLEGTPDGDGFVLTVPATTTTNWKQGTYAFSERVISADGTVVQEVGAGSINIGADLALDAGDGLTHAQRALAAIEAALEGRLADGIQNYSIAGRAVSKIPLVELVKLRDYYRVQVFRERNPGAGFGSVQISFGGKA